jgi:tripartite-type tricarboxylate transporter receptor subunit TctC
MAAVLTRSRGSLGPWLSDRLGQPVIVENRPGAGTNIAMQAVVSSPPSAIVNTSMFENLPFNLQRDIAPVSGLIDYPMVMVAHPSVPAKTIAEFIAYAKANPRKISMASFGSGSASHLAGELFKMTAGVELVHVPYRGGAAMITDLIGGQVQVGFDVITTSMPHIRTGALRAQRLLASPFKSNSRFRHAEVRIPPPQPTYNLLITWLFLLS